MINGLSYPTCEHAFQAFKTLDVVQHELIRTCPTPGQAKKLGRKVLLREGWNDVRDDFMRKFVKLKFENPILRELLIMTLDAELIEGNEWHDSYWGVYRGVGQNRLGVILMNERAEILKDVD